MAASQHQGSDLPRSGRIGDFAKSKISVLTGLEAKMEEVDRLLDLTSRVNLSPQMITIEQI